MSKLYREVFSECAPSEDFEARILNATVYNKRKVMSLSAKVLISCAVVVAVLLGGMLSVSAVTGNSPYEAISSFFAGGTEEVTEELTTGEEPTEPAEESSTEPLTEVSEAHTETPTAETTRKQAVQEKAYYNEWLEKNGKWYYYGADGKKVKYWHQIDDDWYYFNSDGSLAVNTTTIDGCYVDNSGRWIEDYTQPNFHREYTNNNPLPDSQAPVMDISSITITRDHHAVTIDNPEEAKSFAHNCINIGTGTRVKNISPSLDLIYDITVYFADGNGCITDDSKLEEKIFCDTATNKKFLYLNEYLVEFDCTELDKFWEQNK